MATTQWNLDPAHSEITFRVKHLMIANVKGSFTTFSAQVTAEENDFTKATIKASIDTNSVFTNNGDRDNHLKGADFFDAANFPQISFESTSFVQFDADNAQLKGNLTIKRNYKRSGVRS
jgi:polyisoprenoid-binding protein YceI